MTIALSFSGRTLAKNGVYKFLHLPSIGVSAKIVLRALDLRDLDPHSGEQNVKRISEMVKASVKCNVRLL